VIRDLPPNLIDSIGPASLTPAVDDPDAKQALALLNEVREAIVHIDHDWVVTYCNDAYVQGIGLTREEIVGRTPFEYQPSFKRSIFFDSIETARHERRPMTSIGFSAVLNRWMMVRVFPTSKGMLMLANDASETAVRQYQLAQQALKDSLTGLANKLSLVQDMAARLEADERFSLAVLGLNRFTSVNDAQGYSRGDLVLMEIASRLQIASLPQESVYRLYGDEFAVITDGDTDRAKTRIRAMLEHTRRQVVVNGHAFVLGASAGVVPAPAEGQDAEVLLTRALLALRQAKRVAREDIVVYEATLETVARQRTELEAELRSAVVLGQFTLLLQAKGSLQGRHVIGAEALIRWPHPVRGMVPPDQFLPLAQECGLMPAIDRWVLREALWQVSVLKGMGLAVPVSINLSVDSLADEGLVDGVRQALRDAGVEPELLEIEIPEGALMHDVATSARVLAGLDDLGISISVDDFGTGYSSFAYLARFPVHTLKVDRSFVADMTTNAASRSIVKGLVRLAHSLQLQVVAEGAETEEQMTMLQRMHCDEVQGYGFARPMSFVAFCEFVRSRVPAEPGPSAFTI
jgi:diguanylate cyclase (GGDEF)-like protein/PAS domain S-box-containing protein